MMTRCTLVGTLLLGTALAGCATNPNSNVNNSEDWQNVNYHAIKSNLTPEMMGISEREIDINRNMAVVGNQNLRMIWSDLGRAWFFEKPSKLSPYDIINTTGQPTQ